MVSNRRAPKPENRDSRSPAPFPQRNGQQSFEQATIQRAIAGLRGRSLTPAMVLQLQRTIGNKAVAQLISTTQNSAVIQRNPITDKLKAYILDKGKGAVVNKLAAHILAAINAINGKNWKLAHDLLYDTDKAGELDHRIRKQEVRINKDGLSQEEIDAEVEGTTRLGKYEPQKRILNLPSVWVYSNNDLMTLKTTDTVVRLAQKVLPVVLEEWIHMFQYASRSYLSQGTTEFMQMPQVEENQALEMGKGRWDLKEVDIYAVYKDLGWNHVLDEFRGRYPERQLYQEFIHLEAITKRAQRNRGK